MNWTAACRASQENIDSNILYSSQGLAVACLLCSTVFSGLWLNRWRIVKCSDPELLLSVWRFTGLFLFLSFFSGVFGTAAWISKLIQIPGTMLSLRADNSTTCQEELMAAIQLSTGQSAFRICYSLEIGCLILSIILGLDRISEHALNAKSLSKETAPAQREVPSDPNVAGRSLTHASNAGAKRGQLELLLPAAASRSSSGRSSEAESGRTRVLQLLFRAGLAVVAIGFIAAFISIMIAASYSAQIGSLYQSAYNECNPNGTPSEASQKLQNSASGSRDSDSFLNTIFVGYLCEFVAAIVVILLYVVAGCLGVSIVSSARNTIERSLVKLRQLQFINAHEAKAASAGASRLLLLFHLFAA